MNDYLAERDAAQLRPVFEALGLSAGLVKNGLAPQARRSAHEADVTYCTNKDLVFDYLRDRVAIGQRRSRSRLAVQKFLGVEPAPLLLRGLHFAIVDEADSVLIDEARTPLILSANVDAEGGAARFRRALDVAGSLLAGRDYHVSETEHRIEMTTAGRQRASSLIAAIESTGDDWIWRVPRASEELSCKRFRRGTSIAGTNTTSLPTARCRSSTNIPAG
jgi:preprotein translocase subunit SecA